MKICYKSNCRRELAEHWPFCPACGADNRPPHQRGQVVSTLRCEHEWQGLDPFCPLCGYCNDESQQRAWTGDVAQRKVGMNWAIGGGVAVVLAIIVEVVFKGMYGSMQPVVESFEDFDRQVQSGAANPKLKPFEEKRNLVSPALAFGGLGCILYGFKRIKDATYDPLDD